MVSARKPIHPGRDWVRLLLKRVGLPQGTIVQDLRDALNRVVHARILHVGFEKLPAELSVIDGGSVVIPYLRVETDRKPLSFVDPFAVAHALLYGPLAQTARDVGAKNE